MSNSLCLIFSALSLSHLSLFRKSKIICSTAVQCYYALIISISCSINCSLDQSTAVQRVDNLQTEAITAVDDSGLIKLLKNLCSALSSDWIAQLNLLGTAFIQCPSWWTKDELWDTSKLQIWNLATFFYISNVVQIIQ